MGNFIYNFFWWIGGANRDILKGHLEDHNKYFHIGTTVFLTAIMATFTGTFAANYAINKGFDGDISPFAILFGLFWGIIILNLDRFIVVSMTKQGNSLLYPTVYEKFSNFMGEFIFAVPRILLALLIAKILLEPLELYLFKEQVKNYIPIIEMQEKRKLDMQDRDDSQIREDRYHISKKNIENRYNPEIKSLKIELTQKEQNIKDLNNPKSLILEELQKSLESAISTAKSNRQARKDECSKELGGKGSDCNNLKSKQSTYDDEISELKSKIKIEEKEFHKENREYQATIKKLKEDMKSIRDTIIEKEQQKTDELKQLADKKKKVDNNATQTKTKLKEQQSKTDDIAKAIAAKDALFSEPNSKYKDIHTLLYLLLLVIELLPIILKILFTRSSYDAHIQRISEEEMLEHDTYMRELRMKYAKELRELKLIQNVEHKKLEKELKNIKFSSNEE
jgi:hypothetical protein